MPTTIRERISDRLLQTAVQLGTERELMIRSLRSAARNQYDFDRAAGHLMPARWVESTMLWLSARLRPRSTMRQPAESS